MGEYAKRLTDGRKIKIGTCEEMFYCRYEDLHKVQYECDTSGLLWRMPIPEEDGIEPGDYPSHTLLKYDKELRIYLIPWEAMLNVNAISEEDRQLISSRTGIAQTTVGALGMLINVPCHHGLQLPDTKGTGFTVFWNGKRDALYLSHLKNDEKELLVGIECAACGHAWSAPFSEMEAAVKSLWMKLRLLHQCADYWCEHNDEPCYYQVTDKDYAGRAMSIGMAGGAWQVEINGDAVRSGTWQECRNEFIRRLPHECSDSDNVELWNRCREARGMAERYFPDNIKY